MKKILILATALLIGSLTAFGQITTGNPSHKEIKTGNRPEAGDFGLFMGLETPLFAHNEPALIFKLILRDRKSVV